MASELIQINIASNYLTELHLSIKVATPIKVSIIGEVERPTLFSTNEIVSLEGSQIVNSGLPTIVDAIQKAGYNSIINLRKVLVSRRLPGKDKQYKKTSINLLDLILNGNHIKSILI